MGSPLRILQITNRIPFPLNDGGNIASYHVTYYLNKAGNQMTLASLNTKKHFQDPSALKDIADVYTSDIDTTVTPVGLLRGIFSNIPYNVKRFQSQAFEDLLRDILGKNTFDIIQVEGSYMALYLPVLRANSKAPIVLRSHNIEHEIWHRLAVNESNPVKRWYFTMLSGKIKVFEDRTLKLFDAIVAITDRDADYYRKQGFKGELKVINAGADLERFKPNRSLQQKGTICFLAGLDWLPNQQGLDWFIDTIWKELKYKFPDIQLHIAGKSMPERYYALKNQGISVHGMVPDAIEYLQKYEIFIVPLLSGGGMRLKVVEGMALGKCIISTSVGAEGVAYSNGIDIIIADTPEQWIEKISDLINTPEQIYAIGENAYMLANRKYNWKNLIDAFIVLYHSLLQSK
jgi:glycosyltransferase involved in cell wall biosynthesis